MSPPLTQYYHHFNSITTSLAVHVITTTTTIVTTMYDIMTPATYSPTDFEVKVVTAFIPLVVTVGIIFIVIIAISGSLEKRNLPPMYRKTEVKVKYFKYRWTNPNNKNKVENSSGRVLCITCPARPYSPIHTPINVILQYCDKTLLYLNIMLYTGC